MSPVYWNILQFLIFHQLICIYCPKLVYSKKNLSLHLGAHSLRFHCQPRLRVNTAFDVMCFPPRGEVFLQFLWIEQLDCEKPDVKKTVAELA